MSCGGPQNTGRNNPFATTRGVSVCDSIGCRFTNGARAELRRRGFSDAYIDSISVDRFAEFNAASEAIRGATPRQVTIPPDRQMTRQDEIDLFRAQLNLDMARGGGNTSFINRNQAILDQVVNGLPVPVTVDGIDLIVGDSSGDVPENPLNCYSDVQYHITLTMMSEAAGIRYQQGESNQSGINIDLNTLKATNRSDQSITLASTGESVTNNIDTENSTKRNYYNIVSLIVKNITEPSQANPLISTMLSMKMQLAEPQGFKLHEDIKAMACELGYADVNTGRILYRVDISYSGYDDDGEWVEQIDISQGRGVSTISSIMSITNMQAEVTSSGTLYEVDLMPAGHFAYRPEDFVIDAGAIHSGGTFRDFLSNFSKALEVTKEDRTNHQLVRHYEFHCPTFLLDSEFDIDTFFSQNKFMFSGDPGHTISTGRSIDILTVLQGAIGNTVVGQYIFNADQNNENFSTPRVAFGIRFNTIYGEKDPLLYDYKEITHQYIIEPFVTFKQGPVAKETMAAYVDPQNQLIRIREIIRMGMLRRIYNYINTEENSEVINLDIKLKSFYYNTLNTITNDAASNGINNNTSSATIGSFNANRNDLFRVLSSNQNFPQVENTVRRLFGDYRYDVNGASPDTCHKGAARLDGGFNETADTQRFGDTATSAQRRRDDYDRYMKDYLSLDLLKLENMQVRGDPVWLLSPYANLDIDQLDTISATEGISSHAVGHIIKARPRMGQVMFLKMFAPDQTDQLNPDRKQGSSYPTIIGGFYQITNVTSTFKGGKFTQALDGIKMNHLNYVEDLFERSASYQQPVSAPREPTNESLSDAVNRVMRNG